MMDTEIKTLKEVTKKIGSGATPRGGGDTYKTVGVSLIRSQNVLDFKLKYDDIACIDDVQAYELRNVIVEEKDVLLNITGDSVARCCMANKGVLPARVNQHVAIIRVNKDVASPEFIMYNLLYQKDTLLSLSEIGATRRALTKGMIEDLEIQIPSLTEQQSIASVLSSLDDKIDLLHRQNKTLEQMAETLFQGQFKLKIGGYKKRPLSELVTVIDNRGKTPPFTDMPTRYPIIEVNALAGNTRIINYDVIKKYVVKPVFENWFRSGHPKANDILISTVGSIGEMAVFLENYGTIAQNVIALRSIDISPFYLYQYLISIQEEIKEFDIGSVQPSIKVSHLIKLEIPIPAQSDIEIFDNNIVKINMKINANYKQIKILELLRDTLLPKLMNGTIRVVTD